MNPDQHPALATPHDPPVTLTLLLPSQLGKDQTLARLVQAIKQARNDIAARAELFHQRAEQAAACGDTLSQAIYHGKVVAGVHAATAIDEEIIGLFALWDQYPCHTTTGAADTSQPQSASPDAQAGPAPTGQAGSKHPLGLRSLEAAIMAVAWAEAPHWLPVRAVHQRLDYPRPIVHTTVAAAATNLHHKGLLARRDGPRGGWEYQAARSRNEHIGELIADLLDASTSPPAAIAHALRRPVPTVSSPQPS